MLTTLAIVVFLASIIVFFSEEIRKTIFGILKNRRFQLIAPLFLGSWLLIYHEWPIFMFVISCRIGLYYIVYGLAKLSPWLSGPNMIVERIITLFALPALLLGLTDLVLLWKRDWKNVRHVVLKTCAFVWVIAAFLLMFTLSEYFF